MFGLLVTRPEFGPGQAQVEAGQVRGYLGQGRPRLEQDKAWSEKSWAVTGLGRGGQGGLDQNWARPVLASFLVRFSVPVQSIQFGPIQSVRFGSVYWFGSE